MLYIAILFVSIGIGYYLSKILNRKKIKKEDENKRD